MNKINDIKKYISLKFYDVKLLVKKNMSKFIISINKIIKTIKIKKIFNQVKLTLKNCANILCHKLVSLKTNISKSDIINILKKKILIIRENVSYKFKKLSFHFKLSALGFLVLLFTIFIFIKNKNNIIQVKNENNKYSNLNQIKNNDEINIESFEKELSSEDSNIFFDDESSSETKNYVSISPTEIIESSKEIIETELSSSVVQTEKIEDYEDVPEELDPGDVIIPTADTRSASSRNRSGGSGISSGNSNVSTNTETQIDYNNSDEYEEVDDSYKDEDTTKDDGIIPIDPTDLYDDDSGEKETRPEESIFERDDD